VAARRIAWALLLAFVALAAGCAPPPTPFPVTPVVTRPPTAAPLTSGESPALATRAPVRYGVLPGTEDYLPATLRETANVEVLTNLSVASDYDVLVGFGVVDGWQTSPTVMQLALIVNEALPPLDVPEIAAVVRAAAHPAPVVESLGFPGLNVLAPTPDMNANREALANAGYPAGIVLHGRAVDLPGAADVLAGLRASNVEVRLTPQSTTPPHVEVILWRHESERATLVETHGAANVINLYTLPISYTLNDDLLTTFTDDGWIVAARKE
jgi:hypothetical protein